MLDRFGSLNLASECRTLKFPLRFCPPFLFLLMGIVTIVSMIATYFIAAGLVAEPRVAALMVSFVAALFFVIGNLIIRGFNLVAEANRTKSEFISIISHQLGTPLSIFRMTLGLIRRESSSDSPALGKQIAPQLETLAETTERMIVLVRSLLEVNRIEGARLELKKEPVVLDLLTRRVTDNLRVYAAAHNVTFTLNISSPPPTALADAEKMEMAVQNLMDNAIRYSPRGGEAEITIASENGAVRWSIKDRGAGIPAAEQRYIFQKFFRSVKANHTDTHGSGIGLYIAKAIVEACGGKIGFVSEEGKGSTFWFTLPIVGSVNQKVGGGRGTGVPRGGNIKTEGF